MWVLWYATWTTDFWMLNAYTFSPRPTVWEVTPKFRDMRLLNAAGATLRCRPTMVAGDRLVDFWYVSPLQYVSVRFPFRNVPGDSRWFARIRTLYERNVGRRFNDCNKFNFTLECAPHEHRVYNLQRLLVFCRLGNCTMVPLDKINLITQRTNTKIDSISKSHLFVLTIQEFSHEDDGCLCVSPLNSVAPTL